MVETRFYGWLGLLAALQIADLVTTLGALSIGFSEANPIMAHAIASIGPAVLVPIKLLGLGLMVLVAISVPPRGRTRVIGIAVLISGVIVANNLIQLSIFSSSIFS